MSRISGIYDFGGERLLQDNKKNKIQFCRELGSIVNKVLSDSKGLVPVVEELFELYKPRSREEADKLFGFKFNLPDSVGLLCDLRKTDMPDDDEFYDSVAPLSEMAIDVATRMISAGVIIKDIITMYIESIYNEPHDDDTYILLYLTMLKPLSNSIRYLCEKMELLYMETSKLWPDLLVSEDDTDEEEDDDTDEEEESILPKEVKSFQLMRSSLIKAFTEYYKEHKSERLTGFFLEIQDYLETFANGTEPDKEFDFSFSWGPENDENHEIQYIDFHFESEMLQVSSGGIVHDKNAGSDSYTNWVFSIWLNGLDEENQDCGFFTVLELVRSGAKLSIENPDEYMESMEE